MKIEMLTRGKQTVKSNYLLKYHAQSKERVPPINRRWLGRKGHRSLPSREEGTHTMDGWSQKGGEGIPPTSDSVTADAYSRIQYLPKSGWYEPRSTMTRCPLIMSRH